MEFTRVAHRNADAPGLFPTDLNALGLPPQGGWVRLHAKARPIYRRAIRIPHEAGWPDQILWLPSGDRELLGIDPQADNAVVNLPYEGALIDVRKVLLPHEPKVYFAVATFLLALATAVLAYLAAVDYAVPGSNELALAVASSTAVVGCITTLWQNK